MLVSRSTSALEHVIEFCVTTEKLLPQLSLESKFTSYYTLKRRACVRAFLLTFSISDCIGNSMISSDIWHKYHE